MMNSNETRLTVAIADIIISEGLSFNLELKGPESLFFHLSSNIMIWQTHMVTHPQSTISFKAENHRTQAILRYSVL